MFGPRMSVKRVPGMSAAVPARDAGYRSFT